MPASVYDDPFYHINPGEIMKGFFDEKAFDMLPLETITRSKNCQQFSFLGRKSHWGETTIIVLTLSPRRIHLRLRQNGEDIVRTRTTSAYGNADDIYEALKRCHNRLAQQFVSLIECFMRAFSSTLKKISSEMAQYEARCAPSFRFS